MNDFALCTDIEIVMELLDITAKDLAEFIGVTPTTISRWRKNEEQVSSSNLNAFYNFVFEKGIRLNKIKEQLFKEDCKSNSTILFHGAKTYIDGRISIEKSKTPTISAEASIAVKAWNNLRCLLPAIRRLLFTFWSLIKPT